MRFDLPHRRLKHERTVTRADLEKLLAPFIDRTLDRCRSALKDAGLRREQITEVVLVGGSTRIPYVRRRIAEFFGKQPHTELNPDEVVAMGAAIQADILTNGRRGMLLLDVVPLSLGIETLGGVVDKLIHRNTTVPARATTRYTTFVDNQTAININIYQGERELTKDCRSLGKFKLGGIPPMPAQMAQVDVTFLVDANGQLTVFAKELRSGQQASVSVQPAHGLSPDEVEKLVVDSVENAHEDFNARRLVELRNKADADLRHTQRALAQAGDRLSAEQRRLIDAARTNLQDAMAGSDVDALFKAAAVFGDATLPLAEMLMNAVVNSALKGKESAHLSTDDI
jgi:molecular chaperone DnaK (HSP70)